MTCSPAAANLNTRPPKTEWWLMFRAGDHLNKPHGVNRRQMRVEELPTSPAVLAGPVRAGVGRAIDAGMVLQPHHVGSGRTAHHPMRILNRAVFRVLRRHIGCKQALAEHRPALPGVIAFPDATAGNRQK